MLVKGGTDVYIQTEIINLQVSSELVSESAKSNIELPHNGRLASTSTYFMW